MDLVLKLTVKCRKEEAFICKAGFVTLGGSLHSSLKTVTPRHDTIQHTLDNLRYHYSPGEKRESNLRSEMELGKNECILKTNKQMGKKNSIGEMMVPSKTY